MHSILVAMMILLWAPAVIAYGTSADMLSAAYRQESFLYGSSAPRRHGRIHIDADDEARHDALPIDQRRTRETMT